LKTFPVQWQYRKFSLETETVGRTCMTWSEVWNSSIILKQKYTLWNSYSIISMQKFWNWDGINLLVSVLDNHVVLQRHELLYSPSSCKNLTKAGILQLHVQQNVESHTESPHHKGKG
jgi:hypothetical protein